MLSLIFYAQHHTWLPQQLYDTDRNWITKTSWRWEHWEVGKVVAFGALPSCDRILGRSNWREEEFVFGSQFKRPQSIVVKLPWQLAHNTPWQEHMAQLVISWQIQKQKKPGPEVGIVFSPPWPTHRKPPPPLGSTTSQINITSEEPRVQVL